MLRDGLENLRFMGLGVRGVSECWEGRGWGGDRVPATQWVP